MSIENCLVRPNFGDTHQMKNYPNELKIWNIDGSDKYTKMEIWGRKLKFGKNFGNLKNIWKKVGNSEVWGKTGNLEII